MRTRQSILNFASGILFTAVTTLTALLTVPLLADWLGVMRSGAFRVMIECLGYLTLLDLGLGGALSPLLARAAGRGDDRSLRDTLVAGMRSYLKLTLVIIGVGLAATPMVVWLIVHKWDKLAEQPGIIAEMSWAWAICLLSFLPMVLAPFRTLAEARQRGYRVYVLMTVQCLLITALSLLLARLGWGVAGQALAFALGTSSFFAMLAWGGRMHGTGLLRSAMAPVPDAEAEVRRALRALSFPTLMITVSGRIGLMSDNLIVGGFLGMDIALSLYCTVRLAGLAQSQLQLIGGASWAGLAELHARGERGTFNRRLVELTTLVAVLGIAGLGPIAAYGWRFFDFWMGDTDVAFGGNPAILIASANAFLLGLFSLWGWCFAGTGKVHRFVAPSIAATGVNLVASLLLTWQLGLVGPVLGTLVANLAISLWWLPLLVRQEFGVPLRSLFWAVVRPLAWGLPFGVVLWLAARSHRPWGWPGLAAEMGGAALGFLAFGYAVILSPTDRALWRARLEGMLRSLGRGQAGDSPAPPGGDGISPGDAMAGLAAWPARGDRP